MFYCKGYYDSKLTDSPVTDFASNFFHRLFASHKYASVGVSAKKSTLRVVVVVVLVADVVVVVLVADVAVVVLVADVAVVVLKCSGVRNVNCWFLSKNNFQTNFPNRKLFVAKLWSR